MNELNVVFFLMGRWRGSSTCKKDQGYDTKRAELLTLGRPAALEQTT